MVPVGEDQRQHLELTRQIARRINELSIHTTDNMQIFPENIGNISSISDKIPKLMSLQNAQKKMSKSDPNKSATIFLTDDDETIAMKIQRAKTDSQGHLSYTKDRPELKNLLELFDFFEPFSLQYASRKFANDNMFSFKEKLTNLLIEK